MGNTILVKPANPIHDLADCAPFYFTSWGAAYHGDALEVLKHLSDSSVNLIVTSPPYALVYKKEYGNVDSADYVKWFMRFADEFHRVLSDDGSLVIDIGGAWNKGVPTRSLYQFELLIALCKKFHLAQEFYWYNPAKLPSPAEWVTVRRIRVKDSVETLWWLSKTEHPKANNRNVLKPYSDDMQRLIANGYNAKKRPSGHNITHNFGKDNRGAIPPNVLMMGNNDSNSQYMKLCQEKGIAPHPARYPKELPEFFIKFLTGQNDLVLDPFCGSNVTGSTAQTLKRKWIGIDSIKEYLEGSKFRFEATFDSKNL